jgi:hypothetical protein
MIGKSTSFSFLFFSFLLIHLTFCLSWGYRILGAGTMLSAAMQTVFQDWLPSKRFLLLHKATCDGFLEEDLLTTCIGKFPTLTLVQTPEGNIFGGYSSSYPFVPITSFNPQDVCKGTDFIFTLINPHSIPPTKYLPSTTRTKITVQGKWYWLGATHDICMQDRFDLVYFNFPCSYVDSTGRGRRTFTGGPQCRIHDFEVYSVI